MKLAPPPATGALGALVLPPTELDTMGGAIGVILGADGTTPGPDASAYENINLHFPSGDFSPQ